MSSNNRASLLAGLRTGGVRQPSQLMPQTAAPNVSSFGHLDMPMTAQINGSFNPILPAQAQAQARVQAQQAQQQQQAFQMQMMQMEILRLQVSIFSLDPIPAPSSHCLSTNGISHHARPSIRLLRLTLTRVLPRPSNRLTSFSSSN